MELAQNVTETNQKSDTNKFCITFLVCKECSITLVQTRLHV